MSTNKTFRVRLLGADSDLYIEAQDVQETDGGRLRFLGTVQGYEGALSGRAYVASYLSSQVLFYGLEPLYQIPRTGAFVFRVTFASGETQDVRADQLRYAKGNGEAPGLFTLATELADSNLRTEFSAMENQVRWIRRVDDGEDTVKEQPGTVVPAQPDETDTAISK